MLRLLNRRQIPSAIAREEEFSGTNRTIWAFKSFDDNGWEYVIKSYGVPIAKVRVDDVKENGVVVGWKKTLWVTPQKYSVTTSAHTSLVRRGYNLPPKWSGEIKTYEPRVSADI